ncbi:MAG: hypothetical protein K5678_01355 [Acetatifactor sp.]|nr:hypothetical protein [Acetatifactor sp.]
MASNSDYYKLKTKAVDDLVNANESNSPKVSPEEIAKYSGRKRSRIAVKTWLKVCLIKFWFSAAICFFFVWGLGGYLQSLLDMLFVVGIALGLVTDILVNNAIRFLTATDKEAKKWMVFSKKSYVSFLCNVVYGFVQIFLIYTLYNMVNVIAMQITGNQDQVFLSVEPIVFGLFALGIDLMFLGMKKLFGRILEDAKAAARK